MSLTRRGQRAVRRAKEKALRQKRKRTGTEDTMQNASKRPKVVRRLFFVFVFLVKDVMC